MPDVNDEGLDRAPCTHPSHGARGPYDSSSRHSPRAGTPPGFLHRIMLADTHRYEICFFATVRCRMVIARLSAARRSPRSLKNGNIQCVSGGAFRPGVGAQVRARVIANDGRRLFLPRRVVGIGELAPCFLTIAPPAIYRRTTALSRPERPALFLVARSVTGGDFFSRRIHFRVRGFHAGSDSWRERFQHMSDPRCDGEEATNTRATSCRRNERTNE